MDIPPEIMQQIAGAMPQAMQEPEVPEQEAQEPQKQVEPELNNLAEELDDEELKKIGSDLCKSFDRDLESRAEHDSMHEEWIKLYYQNDKAINPPWDGASDECLPDLTEAINQFQSRTYKAFFPNRYFVDCLPVGQSNPGADERAERVGRHMSYQLGVLDKTYKPNKNQMFMAAALHGSDFTKTYFSPIKKRVVVERVRSSDLIVPYGTGPRRIEDVERKTHLKQYSVNETKILAATGWFIEECEPYTGMQEAKIDQAVDEAEGLSKSTSYGDFGDTTCHVLESHCLLDLDGDGISEPYIVWIDRQTQDVKRIQIRYEVDETGLPVNNKEPIEHFTHYQFLPNPDGFYGFGLGHLIGKMNKAGNKLIRMFIDSNELYTVGNMTHLISESLGLPGDEFELSLGRGVKIPRSVDDIKKHFVKLDFDPPSQQTLQLIESLQSRIQRLSANSDILSGNPDKVYQPQAMLAMIEQGLQLFSSVQEFIGLSMEDELQKVFRLNAKYLQDGEYFFEGDQQLSVTKQDYQDDFRVVPVFDPKYSTRSQKLAKAQATYQFVREDPITAQNPTAIYTAGKAVLEALDCDQIDTVYPPPQTPQTVRIDSQNLENTYFLMPPEKRPLFDVFPDQDHITHIKLVDQLIEWIDLAHPLQVPNPPMGDPQIAKLITTLSDLQKQELISNLLRHRSLHVAYMFGQMNGVMDEQGNPITGSGPGPAGNVAQTPGDDPNVEALMQHLSAATGNPQLLAGQGGEVQGADGSVGIPAGSSQR